MTEDTPTARIALAFAVVMVVWGTTYLGVAIMLRDIPVFTASSLRFALAAVVLYAVLRVRGAQPLAGIASPRAFASGVLMSGIGTGFLGLSMMGITSGVAALLNATIPIFVTLIDWGFFQKRRPAFLTALGLVVGFGGVALIANGAPVKPGAQGGLYVGIGLFAVVCWSLGTLVQRGMVPPQRLLALSCVQMTSASVFLGVLAAVSGEWSSFDPTAVRAPAWLAMGYLVIFGSVITQSCYLWLLTRLPAEKVTIYAIVNPAIALVLGVLFLGEVVTGAGALGAALILGGVSLVLFEKPLRAFIVARFAGA